MRGGTSRLFSVAVANVKPASPSSASTPQRSQHALNGPLGENDIRDRVIVSSVFPTRAKKGGRLYSDELPRSRPFPLSRRAPTAQRSLLLMAAEEAASSSTDAFSLLPQLASSKSTPYGTPSGRPPSVLLQKMMREERTRLASLRKRKEASTTAGKWEHDLYEGRGGMEVAGSQIFIRNLAPTVTAQQLASLIARVSGGGAESEVLFVRVEPGPLTTARVGFARRMAASSIAGKLHGVSFQSRTLKVSEIETSKPGAMETDDTLALHEANEVDPDLLWGMEHLEDEYELARQIILERDGGWGPIRGSSGRARKGMGRIRDRPHHSASPPPRRRHRW